jgi:hypothetical protein
MKSKPPTTSYWVFLLGFLAVGAPFSVGVVTTVAAIQESADTKETQGTVVALERGTSAKGGAVNRPVVEYRVAGQTYRCIGKLASNWPVHTVGDQVTVLYKIDDPNTGFIDSFVDRWLCPLLFTGVGSGFMAVLVVALIRQIRDQRAAARNAARRSVSRKAS